ncbi:MAG: BREX system ATP-binding protein BrxD [Myxococcales bacterium]|nr:BREX system ATP-binding protein BrxD [Myxococcales bacterium]
MSRPRRREIISALRQGTVPAMGLEHYAVGLERFAKTIERELQDAALGAGKFKAVRGDYGTGKTFFARWVRHLAQAEGFATAEVQISETKTPLYNMETVYRRAVESLATKEWAEGAFRSLIDRWLYSLEEEVRARPGFSGDESELATQVGELLEGRLAEVSAINSQFSAALRACHRARVENDPATAEGLLAWLMGQKTVGADIKRKAGIKGELDHFAASAFFRGLLEILKQTGRKGLLLVLDEVETIQRTRADSREKSLNALRQMIDELDDRKYPGMYLLITGTPAFYEGPSGVRKAPALEQRLHVDFGPDPTFDSTRAPQIRLLPFDENRLVDAGLRVREIYDADDPERLRARISDDFIRALARQVAGKLGGKVGVAPRIFLRKLVQVMDQVDEHEAFDPVQHYKLDIQPGEMRPEERDAAGIERSVDDIELDFADEKGGADSGGR